MSKHYEEQNGKIYIVEKKYTEFAGDVDAAIARIQESIDILKEELASLKAVKKSKQDKKKNE